MDEIERKEPFRVGQVNVICPACGQEVLVDVVVHSAGNYSELLYNYLRVKFEDQDVSHQCPGRQT